MLVRPTLLIKNETNVIRYTYDLYDSVCGYSSLKVVEQAVIRPMAVLRQATVTVPASRI